MSTTETRPPDPTTDSDGSPIDLDAVEAFADHLIGEGLLMVPGPPRRWAR